jgi:hypothetical protein
LCSPADEPVLTVRDGYVPIGELNWSMPGVVSYARKEDGIFRCATKAGRRALGSGRRQGGYSFTLDARAYRGEMLGIETDAGLARVTPDHKLTALWNERALGSSGVSDGAGARLETRALEDGSQWITGISPLGVRAAA